MKHPCDSLFSPTMWNLASRQSSGLGFCGTLPQNPESWNITVLTPQTKERSMNIILRIPACWNLLQVDLRSPPSIHGAQPDHINISHLRRGSSTAPHTHLHTCALSEFRQVQRDGASGHMNCKVVQDLLCSCHCVVEICW